MFKRLFAGNGVVAEKTEPTPTSAVDEHAAAVATIRALHPPVCVLEDEKVDAVTQRLFAHVTEADLADIRAALHIAPENFAQQFLSSDPVQMRRGAVTLAGTYSKGDFLDRSRLTTAIPPETVHSMTRKAAIFVGDHYHPNMIVEVLQQAGRSEPEKGSFLDFGCSSGRVVRTLYAAYPDAKWYGCDPQEQAVAWATENLPGAISFSASPLTPPTDYKDAMFDGVFAISIWSHYGENAARTWLAEMARIVKPGGWLMVTACGLQTFIHSIENRKRKPKLCLALAETVMREGFAFHDSFGQKGDWGVPNNDWGFAIMFPTWMLREAANVGFDVTSYHPGRLLKNQDVYLLRRRD